MSRAGRRPGVAVLNVWLGADEKAWLQAEAARVAMPVTMFLRMLLRREMERQKRDGWDEDAPPRWRPADVLDLSAIRARANGGGE